ncbi:MAG: N-acyl homoserine lactonase family protein [Polyangiales bacterium]
MIKISRAGYSVGPVLMAALTGFSWLATTETVSADDTAPASVQLYALDCGRFEIDDMSAFSDAGEYDGRSGSLVNPCFLVRHPKGDLLWDLGLPESAAANGGEAQPGTRVFYDTPLATQLEQVGLTPADIEFIAFSHMHFDHTGGANAFTASTWLLNQRELAWATLPETAASGAVDPSSFSGYATAPTQIIDGDFDVFGDGSVRILRAPGHTPGHQLLLVTLPRDGKYLLGGDLYHTKENQRELRVPQFNVSRADTLASFDRAIRLVRAKKARFIVQHSPEDFATLPKFPAHLE